MSYDVMCHGRWAGRVSVHSFYEAYTGLPLWTPRRLSSMV